MIQQDPDNGASEQPQTPSRDPAPRGPCHSLVRLEVPVDDAVVVQVLQRQHRLGEVHARHVHGQRAHVLQERGTVATCRSVDTLAEILGSAAVPRLVPTCPPHLRHSVPSLS